MNYRIWSVALSATIMHGNSHDARTLGKTHFIVGMPQKEYKQYQHSSNSEQPSLEVADSNPAHKIFFAPDDDIHAELLQLIKDEKDSIKMAMYLFTDKEIAQALQNARQRGVRIECITDATCLSNKFNRVDDLAHGEIPVWVYRISGNDGALNNAMHNKFMVLGSSGKVVTGSLNITHSAQTSNQENVVVLADKYSVERFGTHFEKLKTRCSRLTPQKSAMNLKEHQRAKSRTQR